MRSPLPIHALSRAVAAILLGCARTGAVQAQAAAADPPRPTLVVFITVDQLRADLLDRWGAQLHGGLARLARQGAFFVHGYQEHAVTETAPGHSVTLSGRFPRSTGILRNTAGVEDPQAPLLTSADPGASPYRFRGSTLIDWLRTRDARARALSVSRKDRGAILPLGRAKQHVFWYAASNGEFTTSRYYGDTLPAWIRAFNARRLPQRLAGRSWRLTLPPSEYAEPDSVPVENGGHDLVFPHTLPADTGRAVVELIFTPWIDELTAAAALAGLRELHLGEGPPTDLLAVSFSAADYVGHRYGPDSREQHDNILRLDRTLGAFIDSLYRLRDSSRIVIALTADHGVTPFPELVRGARGVLRYDLRPAVEELRSSLRARHVDTSAVTLDGPLVYVDRALFARAGVEPDHLLAHFAEAARRLPGIARVDRVRDLAARDTVHDVVARRWAHMIPLDSPVEWVITPREGAYPSGATIAEHGTPYDDDAHVPVIFYGPWFRPGRYEERATVADMAPTLAAVVGVPPTEPVDGRVLRHALVSPPPPY